ncbi:transglutaminase family protein [Limibacter armeniacum]|uniref:transglutaminase family protein n=1 Tax=Limibacter armeniacum TaxID=466084 RepID=UPI002FE5843D
MDANELKALLTLMSDDDPEVVSIVKDRLESMSAQNLDALLNIAFEDGDSAVVNRLSVLMQNHRVELTEFRLSRWIAEQSGNVLELLWIIAAFERPLLSIKTLNDVLVQLNYDIWLEMQHDLYPVEKIKKIDHLFWQKLGFKTYQYHKSNKVKPTSMLMVDEVMSCREGNYLIICMLYLLVGQRLNMPVSLVKLPSVFLFRYTFPDNIFYVHPFSRRMLFSRKELEGYAVQMHKVPEEVINEHFSGKELATVLLKELRVAYQKEENEQDSKLVDKLISSLMWHR